MYTWNGQVNDPVEGNPGAPSPFAELFTLDSKASRISPSLPLTQHGYLVNHVNPVFRKPGSSASYDAITKVLNHNTEARCKEFKNAFCRLFVVSGDVTSCGSAFFVSPTVLVTANHAAVTGHKKIFLGCYGPSLECCELPENVQDLVPVEDYKKDIVAQLRAAQQASMCLDVDPIEPHDPTKGSIAQSDFAFLRVAPQSPYRANKFFLPNFKFDGKIVAQLGYPGTFVDYHMIKEYKPNESIPAIFTAFGNIFNHKHVAPGAILKEDGRLMAHSASTLKGSSGGPIIDPDNFFFVGIHIEGWADVNWNLAVCAWHPAFKAAYEEIVLPTLPEVSRETVRAVNA